MATSYNHVPTPAKTYATRANAAAAVQKRYPDAGSFGAADLQYLVLQGEDGRWFPVFIGERALRHGVHIHFPVVA